MNSQQDLKGKKVAFLATNGVEQSELTRPWDAVEEAGGKPHLVSIETGEIQAEREGSPATNFTVDATVDAVKADDYDALVLPGGVANPDRLRMNDRVVDFVREFFEQGKPVAAICHGPQLLIEANVVDGRKLTSYASIATDLRNAGANWVDEECVCDEGLVTSRTPKDLGAFCDKLVEEIAEGKHELQTA